MKNSYGINIAGHINGEFGIAEAVRSNIKAMSAADIPYVLNNLHIPDGLNTDRTYTDFSRDNPYPINFVHTNPNWIERNLREGLFEILKPEYFKGRYNIGFWAWELPKFPPAWEFAFEFFDEIWTPSNYCAEAISAVSPVPVYRIPHSISLPQPNRSKRDLGIPEDQFIFLFTFDFGSSFERKNVLAAVDAFQQAFGKSNPNVLLVVKYYNEHHFPKQAEQLKVKVENSSSIFLLGKHLEREDLNALIYHCDCYVSLHRAEGFGLTMAEAMYYGKPVIATAYSSNLDFMDINNSFLVGYRLIETTEAYGAYPKGSIWAEPDVDHTASLMHYVFDNYRQAQEIGIKAAKDVRKILSPQTIGDRIRERLDFIANSIEVLKVLEKNHPDYLKMRSWKLEAQQIGKELKKIQSQLFQSRT